MAALRSRPLGPRSPATAASVTCFRHSTSCASCTPLAAQERAQFRLGNGCSFEHRRDLVLGTPSLWRLRV